MAAEDDETGDRENADPNRCSTADAPLSPENTEGDSPVPSPHLHFSQLPRPLDQVLDSRPRR
jgi:hypothetical protein